MKPEQEHLQALVDLRRKFMRVDWSLALINTATNGKVTVRFSNSPFDFRETAYPSVSIALEQQRMKLTRDVIEYVGKENMDTLAELL